MSQPILRPLGFGEILDGAFKLYRRHFTAVFSTALIAIGPMVLLWGSLATQMTGFDDPDSVDAGAFGALFLAAAAAMLLFGVMYVALTRLFSQAYVGGEVSVADAYRAGLRRFLPALAAWVVIFIGWMVVVFAGALMVAVVVGIGSLAAAGGGAAGGIVMVALGVVLAVVAVVVAFVVYAALAALWMGVLAPIVVEGMGPFAAIGRWIGLARGAFWRVIGMAAVTFMLVMLPAFGVLVLSGTFTGVWSADPGQTSAMAFWLQQVVSTLVSALTYPFMMAAFVLLYYDRRVRVEALDVEMAAEGLAPVPARVEA